MGTRFGVGCVPYPVSLRDNKSLDERLVAAKVPRTATRRSRRRRNKRSRWPVRVGNLFVIIIERTAHHRHVKTSVGGSGRALHRSGGKARGSAEASGLSRDVGDTLDGGQYCRRG